MFTKIKITKEVMKRIYELTKKGYSQEEIEKISQEISTAINSYSKGINYKEAVEILDKEFAKY